MGFRRQEDADKNFYDARDAAAKEQAMQAATMDRQANARRHAEQMQRAVAAQAQGLTRHKLTISAARDSGWIVEWFPHPSVFEVPLFAGTLDECVEYVRRELAKHDALIKAREENVNAR